MKTRKKITIGVIVAFLAVVMVGYIYLFTGAKIKNVSNDVIKGDEETKSLVVYFTRQGVIPGDVDAVSSATQSSNKGMEGSDTEGAARMIQSLTGADMYQIYTAHYYRRSFVGTAATAWIEELLNLRPELAVKPDNLDDYDTIYVGYPIWWFNAPMAIGSFLESYDLSGKTIIPFCTSQDNDISVSMDYIKAVASGANVLDGYRIHAADVDDVKEWLQRIGVLNENNTKDLNAETQRWKQKIQINAMGVVSYRMSWNISLMDMKLRQISREISRKSPIIHGNLLPMIKRVRNLQKKHGYMFHMDMMKIKSIMFST